MRLLLIEPEANFRETIKRLLTASSHAVDIAASGEDAVRRARLCNYDLIIIAETQPQTSGLRLCHELRDAGRTSPILFLADKQPADWSVFIGSGMDDYMLKPFANGEFMFRVQSLLHKPRKSLPPLLKVDDLVMDTMSQRVRRGKREIYLTRKEFALLEYFMRNRGEVLGRAVLMEHVWDETLSRFSNTIEAHVLNLRRKIDIKGLKKLIHTCPGRGYKLDVPNPILF